MLESKIKNKISMTIDSSSTSNPESGAMLISDLFPKLNLISPWNSGCQQVLELKFLWLSYKQATVS